MPDSSPTHESSPGPASPSAPPADAVPAPAAADEAAPLLVSSTETPRDEALQAPTRSRLVYVLTLLSVAFSIDTLVVVLVTQFIRPYWHYLPWGFYDKQTGLGGVTALALIVSSINLSRLRGNRPLIPLFFNMIFDLAICFYAIALATPGLADMIDYRDCTYADDEDECLRGALPVRIVAGVMLGTALVVGVIHLILLVLRCLESYRSEFWRRPINFPTGQFTLQFTVKVLKHPEREEESV